MSKTATKAASTTAATLRQIATEVSQEFFERAEAIEVFITALLAREHVFWLGEPGIAKSALAQALCRRLMGANFFEITLHRLMGEQQILGAVDIPHYDRTGEWLINSTDKAPQAHVIVLDELGKTGPNVQNPLLELLNERKFKPNGKKITVPLITCVGTSNETLGEDESAAFWDRFLIRQVLQPIQEPGNFAAFLRRQIAGTPATAPTMLPLADLLQAHADVEQVTVPQGVLDTVMQLKAELRAEQIRPSDRRFGHAMKVLQAYAYYQGRTEVEEDDLAILRHVLWEVPEQIPMVDKKTLSLTSPLAQVGIELQTMLDEINGELDSRKGQSDANRAQYGAEANRKLMEINKKLADTIEKANRKGRSTVRLETVKEQIRATRLRVFVEALNMPAESAERAVGI